MEVILNDKPIVLEKTVDLATGEKFSLFVQSYALLAMLPSVNHNHSIIILFSRKVESITGNELSKKALESTKVAALLFNMRFLRLT